MWATRLGWEPGLGSLEHARASPSAQPSANGPTYATRPISCSRLRHCRFADLRAGQLAGACCEELEQTTDRNCSGSTFSLPYCVYYYYYYHHLALLVLCYPTQPRPPCVRPRPLHGRRQRRPVPQQQHYNYYFNNNYYYNYHQPFIKTIFHTPGVHPRSLHGRRQCRPVPQVHRQYRVVRRHQLARRRVDLYGRVRQQRGRRRGGRRRRRRA